MQGVPNNFMSKFIIIDANIQNTKNIIMDLSQSDSTIYHTEHASRWLQRPVEQNFFQNWIWNLLKEHNLISECCN